jgi:hypothetical protein
MNRWWVFAVYDDMQKPSLQNAHTVWWDSWKQQILQTPPDGWIAFFGTPSQDEHPHEIAATMLVSNDTASEAGRRLLNNTKVYSPIRRVT